MATKGGSSFLKEESFVNDNPIVNGNQYFNFNLNQNYKCPILIPVQSDSTFINDKYSDSTGSDNFKEKAKSQLWNKSSKFTNLNEDDDVEFKKQCKKGGTSDTINNNSTLSLHIKAYENSFKANASDSFVGKTKESFNKEKYETSQIFPSSTFVIQNPFEFSRQQNDKISEPGVSQFKISQRLINPNVSSNNQQQEVNERANNSKVPIYAAYHDNNQLVQRLIEIKMGRGKPKIKPHPTNQHPKPNETSLRISFLQQAAKLMAEKSYSKNDTPSLLSKLYMEELNEVRNIQQTLLSKDLRRSYCRHCNRIWIPNQSGDNGIDVKITKDRIYRKCKDCNSIASFVRNSKYRSRNEKV